MTYPTTPQHLDFVLQSLICDFMAEQADLEFLQIEALREAGPDSPDIDP